MWGKSPFPMVLQPITSVSSVGSVIAHSRSLNRIATAQVGQSERWSLRAQLRHTRVQTRHCQRMATRQMGASVVSRHVGTVGSRWWRLDTPTINLAKVAIRCPTPSPQRRPTHIALVATFEEAPWGCLCSGLNLSSRKNKMLRYNGSFELSKQRQRNFNDPIDFLDGSKKHAARSLK
jgi:hypothetical protein